MIPTDVLLAFIATTCGFMLIPGPAMLYSTTVGVERGRNAGLSAAGGLAIGCLLLATGAAMGLTAVLAASETLFVVFKICGVAYLVYLGSRRLLTPMTDLATNEQHAQPPSDGARRKPGAGVFGEVGRGTLVSISNPKDALFFFAFLPQFTSSAHGSIQLQMLLLGGIFALIALVFDGCYGLLGARLRRLFMMRPGVWRSQRWVAGFAYLFMAALAAFSSNRARTA
ncbi:LysE family translocator [Phytoactinopolyspora alkaliphila]|uniref:LysE family translocator n=1 Tax=Phytoactinopolyspora alkaliphila TaxID=1783498 RepID=A0A6N9YGG3_9ACTN|nr:LysE family translocator [Phytoactinopolyspora alkaliphila]NED93998.1 LysE family translocator [Phytoactinopolyspora alkaliphila]